MQLVSDLLKNKVSYQENTWSQIAYDTTIELILSDIKSSKYKSQVEDLREQLKKGNKEYYDNHKKKLPAVTFSATFEYNRTKDKLKSYNPIIVIDIDKIDDLKLNQTFEQLNQDEYVISFWRSPSDNGYKGLIGLDYQVDNSEIQTDTLHKSAFNKLSNYFFDRYSIVLDKSGNDITRLCFLSYDNNLIIKSQSKKFVITTEDIISSVKPKVSEKAIVQFTSNRDALYNSLNRNNQFDRKIMTDIIRFLINKDLSITDKYDDWCKVGMAISNTFTYDIGIKYFLKLSALDTKKFNEVISTNFLINCYETRKGAVNFNSIVYLANQKGYKTKKQKKGVPKAED